MFASITSSMYIKSRLGFKGNKSTDKPFKFFINELNATDAILPLCDSPGP